MAIKSSIIPALALTLLQATSSAASSNLPQEKSVTNNKLPIYESPGSTKVVTTIDPKNGVTVLPNEWVHVINHATQQQGWVKKDDLEGALQQSNDFNINIVKNSFSLKSF